ncbi:MAG: hypothetical protein QXI58_05795 [Candidatus Micrarchaeia archaeon]
MKKVIAYYGTATKNTEGDVTIYTVPSGQVFTLEKVEVVFGSGVDFDLELSIYHGIKQVVPHEGVIAGSPGRIPLECEWKWQSGDRIILHYKNSNSTTDFKYSCYLIGDLR